MIHTSLCTNIQVAEGELNNKNIYTFLLFLHWNCFGMSQIFLFTPVYYGDIDEVGR